MKKIVVAAAILTVSAIAVKLFTDYIDNLEENEEILEEHAEPIPKEDENSETEVEEDEHDENNKNCI